VGGRQASRQLSDASTPMATKGLKVNTWVKLTKTVGTTTSLYITLSPSKIHTCSLLLTYGQQSISKNYKSFTIYQKILMIPCIICDIFDTLLNPHLVLIQLLFFVLQNSKLSFQRCNAIRSINGCASQICSSALADQKQKTHGTTWITFTTS